MKGFTFLSTANLEFDARLKFGECMKKGNMEFSTSLGTKLHNWELAVVPMACLKSQTGAPIKKIKECLQ